jgi:hypothetical protein
MMALSPTHRKELTEGSAIAADVIAERGTITVGKSELPDVFIGAQRKTGLLLPLHNVHGEQPGWQLKPDHP